MVMWIHLVAAITWMGGLLFMWLVLKPVLLNLPAQSQGSEALYRVEERFRTVRWISLLTLLATGVYNLIHEGGSARLESAWGGVLIIKLFLVAVAMGLTGISDFLLSPVSKGASLGSSGRLHDVLGVAILVLGLAIVFIAVYLGG